MSKKYSFNELSIKFKEIDKIEKMSIIGGDFVNDLITKNIFVRNADLTNDSEWNLFLQDLRMLDSTAVGHDLLNQLYTTNTSINISSKEDITPQGQSAMAAYQTSTHTLDLGPFDNTMTPDEKYDPIVHELFHAYQDVTLHENGSINGKEGVRKELDAQLFARMSEVEYDVNKGLNDNSDGSLFHMGQDYTNRYGDNQTQSQKDFESALDDILENHDFSIDNYNKLVNNFIMGSIYSNRSNLSADPVENLDNVSIFNIYSKDYSGKYKPSLILNAIVNTDGDSGDSGSSYSPNIGGSDFYGFSDTYYSNGGSGEDDGSEDDGGEDDGGEGGGPYDFDFPNEGWARPSY